MARTPAYVRLADRLCLGMQVDIESGWGISGFDVRHFPDEEENPVAHAWAKRQLQLGNLEEAGKAEWDEVHEADVAGTDGVDRVILVDADKGIPENKLREQIRTTGQKLEKRRSLRATEALDAELDAELDDEDEDGYVDVARGSRAGDAQGATALERRRAQRLAGEAKSTSKKKGKKSGSKSKARQAEDDDEDSGSSDSGE